MRGVVMGVRAALGRIGVTAACCGVALSITGQGAGAQETGTLAGVIVSTVTEAPLPVGGEPNGLQVGDLNGDGRPDLLAAESGFSVSLLFNQGGEVVSFGVTDDLKGALEAAAPDGVAVAG